MQLKGSDEANLAAVLLLFCWVGVAGLSATSSNDLWIHLRVGRDILTTGHFPTTDIYSAVTFGLPFTAHEWLSACAFYLVAGEWGGAGLSVLQSLLPLLGVLCLCFSLKKEHRWNGWPVLILALCSYVILCRGMLRPHVFAMMFLCFWVFCLERWRRSGRLRELLPLVPLQIVWANAHGSFVLPIALLLGLAAAVGALARWPMLQRDPLERRYTWKDARQLFLVGAACGAVSLINPNGVRLFAFSFHLMFEGTYLKGVYEWERPFQSQFLGRYLFWAHTVVLLLLWGSLALRWKQRPWLDLAVATVATYLGVSALRFISDVAIISFPVIIRSLAGFSPKKLFPVFRKGQRVFVPALLGLLVANTVAYGFPIRPGEHRKVELGFGSDALYSEVRALKRLRVEGVAYTTYEYGGLVIGALHPKVRPVVDSRIDLYGQKLMDEYTETGSSRERFLEYLSKYKVNIALLPMAAPSHMEILESELGWEALCMGDFGVLLVSEATAEAIQMDPPDGEETLPSCKSIAGNEPMFVP